MAKKADTKKEKHENTRDEMRHGLFLAAVYRHIDGKLNYYRAGKEMGLPRQTIWNWADKHPELVKEVEPQAEEFRKKADELLKDKLVKTILLGLEITHQMLERCLDEQGVLVLEKKYDKQGNLIGYLPVEKLRDVVGEVVTYLEKKQLLEGKATSNVVNRTHLEEVIMIIAEERAKGNANPRLKDIQN